MEENEDILKLFNNQLKMLLLSPFAPYKHPSSMYEHLINCWAVDLEVKRKGISSDCQLEKSWKELKMIEFPREAIVKLIVRASKKAEFANNNQRKISDFFTPKSKSKSSNPAPPDNLPDSELLELEEDVNILEPRVSLEEDVNILEPRVSLEEAAQDNFSMDLRKLCILLGLADGKHLRISQTSNISILAQKVVPVLKLNQELSEKVDKRATRFQRKSDFTIKRSELEEELSNLKKLLQDLIFMKSSLKPWR